MRSFLVAALAVIGIVLLPLADLGAWVERELLNTSSFTSLADDVIAKPEVRAALAEQVAERLEKRDRGLRRFDAAIRTGADRAVQTAAFRVLFGTAVSTMHGQLVNREDQLSLDLEGLVPLVQQQVPPEVARRIPVQTDLGRFTVIERSELPALWNGVRIAQRAAIAFPIVSLLLIAAAIGLARRRGVTAAVVGIAGAVITLLIVSVVQFGRSLLENINGTDVQHRAFDAGADVVGGSLVKQTLLMAGLFLVVAGVGIVSVIVSRGNERPAEWA